MAFFEKKIRPVLVDQCYSCHSAEAEKLKGGLALDTRDGLRAGGDSGASIVPGSPDKSLLITALRHTDDDLKMPPKQKLPAAVIADFEQWVAMGAPDPREGAATAYEEAGYVGGGERLVGVAAGEKIARSAGERRHVAEERHRSLSPGRNGSQGAETCG